MKSELLRSSEKTLENGYVIYEEIYGYLDKDGIEIITATFKEEKNPNEINDNIIDEVIEESVSTSEIKMQLDNIQVSVEKSNDELRQEGAEAVTLELIERGIL